MNIYYKKKDLLENGHNALKYDLVWSENEKFTFYVSSNIESEPLYPIIYPLKYVNENLIKEKEAIEKYPELLI